MIITLTGFMGCGKSTVGKLLSRLLPGHTLTDLDCYIEQKKGKKVSEIFAEEGEAAFRKMEEECLRELILDGKDRIISLGGGTVMSAACFSLVHDKSRCVYLKADAKTIRKHLTANCSLEKAAQKRPMLRGNGIEELLGRREPVYESVAHMVVETDGRDARSIAEEISWRLGH